MPRILVTLLLLPLATAASAASTTMQPGLWEITTMIEIPGLSMQMPPQTIRHCYTKKDVEQGERSVPRSDDKSCQVKDYTLKGNTATWTIMCTGASAMTGTGSMTMTPTSYTGTMKSTITRGGGSTETTQRWSAKRIGDCQP